MLPYYKQTVLCDWCGEYTHGRIFEKDILCGSCKKVIINDWEKSFDDREPERYHEWILWKFRKEENEETCSDNTGASRNRQDNNSLKDS
tara:strand:+ start:1271 stop:1537 length:267 start_codon:yes stop_codon:yes gene_type:complete